MLEAINIRWKYQWIQLREHSSRSARKKRAVALSSSVCQQRRRLCIVITACTFCWVTRGFPGVPFPRDFRQICKKILTRLFRVFVHVYIHHFDRLVGIGAVSYRLLLLPACLLLRVSLGVGRVLFTHINSLRVFYAGTSSSLQEPHVNTLYKHFYYFVTEYNMVSSKELDALVSYTLVRLPQWCLSHTTILLGLLQLLGWENINL